MHQMKTWFACAGEAPFEREAYHLDRYHGVEPTTLTSDYTMGFLLPNNACHEVVSPTPPCHEVVSLEAGKVRSLNWFNEAL